MVVGGEQSDSLSLSCGISRFGAGISKCTGSGEGLDTKGSSSKAKESLADFVGVSVGDSPRNNRRTNVRISIFLTSYSRQHYPPPSPTLFSLWFLYNLIAKYLYKCNMGKKIKLVLVFVVHLGRRWRNWLYKMYILFINVWRRVQESNPGHIVGGECCHYCATLSSLWIPIPQVIRSFVYSFSLLNCSHTTHLWKHFFTALPPYLTLAKRVWWLLPQNSFYLGEVFKHNN